MEVDCQYMIDWLGIWCIMRIACAQAGCVHDLIDAVYMNTNRCLFRNLFFFSPHESSLNTVAAVFIFDYILRMMGLRPTKDSRHLGLKAMVTCIH